MSGYDPMEELGASLEALETPLKRRITIAPPPTDDFTVEIDRPSTAPESVDEFSVAAPAITSARAGAPASQRRGSGLVTRRPNGQMKSITASLPAHLVDRVTEMRLDAGVAGKSFKLTELLSTAILDLPTKPTAVAAMVERYASQFNYERSPGEDGFLEEKRLSTQITPDAAKRVASIVRSVYHDFGVKLSNKDLYAIALLALLADRD